MANKPHEITFGPETEIYKALLDFFTAPIDDKGTPYVPIPEDECEGCGEPFTPDDEKQFSCGECLADAKAMNKEYIQSGAYLDHDFSMND